MKYYKKQIIKLFTKISSNLLTELYHIYIFFDVEKIKTKILLDKNITKKTNSEIIDVFIKSLLIFKLEYFIKMKKIKLENQIYFFKIRT